MTNQEMRLSALSHAVSLAHSETTLAVIMEMAEKFYQFLIEAKEENKELSEDPARSAGEWIRW